MTCVIISAMLVCHARTMTVVYSNDQPAASRGGSTLRLTLDIDRLADEWLDRQGIKNPAERKLLKLLSTGRVGDQIESATRDCSSYVTIVNVTHPKAEDWPDRVMEIRPENPKMDTFKLLAYKSTSHSKMDIAFASVTVICIAERDQPKITFQSHMRYTQSKWETLADQRKKAAK